MPLVNDIRGQLSASPTLMSRHSGKSIDDVTHLGECIVDILMTPIGSRMRRRNYGSGLFKLIDRPIGPLLGMQMRSAIVTALNLWEPRLRITRILLDTEGFVDGVVTITIEGLYLLNGQVIRLQNLSLDFLKSSRYKTNG